MPDLRFDIVLSQRTDFDGWMGADDFDLGLALLPLEKPGLKAIEFAAMRLVLLIPPGWDTDFTAPVDMDALADQPLIMTGESTLLRQIVAGEFQRHGIKARPVGQASTSNTVCKLVESGLGLGVTDPADGDALCAQRHQDPADRHDGKVQIRLPAARGTQPVTAGRAAVRRDPR